MKSKAGVLAATVFVTLALVFGTTGEAFAQARELTAQGNQLLQQGSGGLKGSSEPALQVPTGFGGVYRYKGDNMGEATATGDFNGDGKIDVAVGAPNEDAPLTNIGENAEYEALSDGRGAVSVVYGSGGGLSAEAVLPDQLLQQGSDGLEDVARDGDLWGSALVSGDFDNDGFDDLAVGGPRDAVGGSAHVIYGSRNGLTGDRDGVIHQDTANVHGSGEGGDRFGFALAAGDFDANGHDDLAVGAPGEDASAGAATVFYFKPGGGTFDWKRTERYDQNECLGCLPKSEGLLGTKEGDDEFGFALAAGDFSGNGAADLAVGVPGEDDGAEDDAGAFAAIYSEPGDGLWPEFGPLRGGNQLWDQKGSLNPAYDLVGALEGGDRVGYSLVAGDFNGDGTDDVASGAPQEAIPGSFGEVISGGAVNVVYGTSFDSGLNEHEDRLFDQNTDGVVGTIEAEDDFGWHLTAGDFNEDGYEDLATGVPGEDDGKGAVSVLFGADHRMGVAQNQLWEQDTNGVLGTGQSNDRFGEAVAAGDFNGDGASDLSVGVPNERADDAVIPGQNAYAGAANILYGSPHPDATPPVVTASVAGTEGSNGWYKSAATLSFSVSDPESRVRQQGCGTVTVSGETTGRTFTCRATSFGGETTREFTVKVDMTKPTMTLSKRPEPNAAGWYNDDVTYEWSCEDAVSGPAANPVTRTETREGQNLPMAQSCTDNAGNGVVDVHRIKVDKTPPKVTAVPYTGISYPYTAGQWTESTVKVRYTCEDSLSGVGGCPPEDQFNRAGRFTATSGPATDNAGNQATTTFGPILIDRTSLDLSITTPKDGATYTRGEEVVADYACTEDAEGLAVKRCEGSVPDGSPLDTTTSAGEKTFTVNARDGLDRTNSRTVSYTVANPVPRVTSTGPASVRAGGGAFTLAVEGSGFVPESKVRWNGQDLESTHVSATRLEAQVPAEKLAAADTAEVTVQSPGPGGGTSELRPFFVLATNANVTDVSVGSSDNPAGTARAGLGGASGLSVEAAGQGTVAVAKYGSNPGGATSFVTGGSYFDVYFSEGNGFTGAEVSACDLGTGNAVYWWNGAKWAPVSDQVYDPATGCVRITLGPTTSPSLSQMGGTVFGTARYTFSGFSPPVANPPATNAANAGRTVPIKFGLGGDQGLDVLAAGHPKLVRYDCATGRPTGASSAATSTTGLTYDAASARYAYEWKTDRTLAGTCQRFVLQLKNGQRHEANFRFR